MTWVTTKRSIWSMNVCQMIDDNRKQSRRACLDLSIVRRWWIAVIAIETCSKWQWQWPSDASLIKTYLLVDRDTIAVILSLSKVSHTSLTLADRLSTGCLWIEVINPSRLGKQMKMRSRKINWKRVVDPLKSQLRLIGQDISWIHSTLAHYCTYPLNLELFYLVTTVKELWLWANR